MNTIKKFGILISFLLLLACGKDDAMKHLPLGQWKLAEVVMDPGDGNLIVTPVTANKILEIKEDSTYTVNGFLCGLGIDTVSMATGKVDFMNQQLLTPDCFGPQALDYIHSTDTLTLDFGCIEPCQHKYLKI